MINVTANTAQELLLTIIFVKDIQKETSDFVIL